MEQLQASSICGARLRDSFHITLFFSVVRRTHRYVHTHRHNLNVKQKVCSITGAIKAGTTNFRAVGKSMPKARTVTDTISHMTWNGACRDRM